MNRWHVALLLTPSAVLLSLFFVALSNVLTMSILDAGGTVSFVAYATVFGDDYYRGALLRSAWIATYCSFLCLFLGYPIAYVMSRGSRRFATFATLMLAIQFFSIYVVKMYGWMLVLGNNGVINRTLMGLGIADAPVKLMYNELGVAIGLIASALPLMVFPINAVLQNASTRYEEAALGLGAGRWRTLVSITLPLSAPGIIGGVVLTFVFCFTAYLTPALLGGGFFKMIGNHIYDQAVSRFNYPLAGAAAVVTLVVSLAVIVIINSFGPRMLRTREP